MKTRIMVCVVFLLFVVTSGMAQVMRPVAVSPGGDTGVAVVGQNCPTFSWSAVTGAPSYRIEVFQAVGTTILSYEEMAGQGTAVLQKEIPGAASSWTPSWEEQLSAGVEYAWYVGAMDVQGNIVWSKGKAFRVDTTLGLTAVVEKVKEKLKALGLSEESISGVFAEDRTGVVKGLTSGFSLAAPQGYEGPANTFYGLNAGINTTGNWNTFLGWGAGLYNTTGYRNLFAGWAAGYANTEGSFNTFLGWAAGINNVTAHYNTFVGYGAGYANVASWNTFLGYAAGYCNTTGNGNLFAGWGAGYANNSGSNNTFLGWSAGASNTTAYDNTFMGYGAGSQNIAGVKNTFVGRSAGSSNTTGDDNIFLGVGAGYANKTGRLNTMVGNSAGYNNTAGPENTLIGYQAGFNSNAAGNTFVGFRVGAANQGGNYNSIFGWGAAYNLNGGSYNTILGMNAGEGITTGYDNVFVGQAAGYALTTGHGNIFLGHSAGEQSNGSNLLYIDNTSTSLPLILGDFSSNYLRFNGNVGIQTSVAPTHRLDVGTAGAYCDGGAWVNGSSRTYKDNITSLTTEEAVEAFKGLEPVKYVYKDDKEEQHIGFIAEDVPELVATKDRKGLSPMDIVAVLTKVVQEQQKTISDLKERIAKLEKQR